MFCNGYRTEFPENIYQMKQLLLLFYSDHDHNIERLNIVNASKHQMSSWNAVGEHMCNVHNSKSVFLSVQKSMQSLTLIMEEQSSKLG